MTLNVPAKTKDDILFITLNVHAKLIQVQKTRQNTSVTLNVSAKFKNYALKNNIRQMFVYYSMMDKLDLNLIFFISFYYIGH